MPNKITIDLIRRRAEHNEGLIHTLEELSLHQEELESIDDILGCNCRRLKILYLQNNIIGEMKNLHHMKELEYLNLALNNISKVEGLQSCEFLNKLDLTVNFVDMDELESSVTAMEGNRHLRDLYMMGNPCQSWHGFEAYVIARLSQLERLDGKEITRTDRIRAQQRLPALREEIVSLAEEVRQRKHDETRAARLASQDDKNDGGSSNDDCRGAVRADSAANGGQPTAQGKNDDETTAGRGEATRGSGAKGGEEELTKHTPEVRTAIYREMAEQKREKEERQRENLPKDRNFELEQAAAVERARKRETEGKILQCNEGKLEFRFEETQAASSSPGELGRRQSGRGSSGGDLVLEVAVPKYLDSSLIDLDVHPHYVSIVIKGKVLRLSLQAEVKAGEAKARRSKTTGSLVVTMPKVDPEQSIGLIPTDGKRRAPGVVADRMAAAKNAAKNDAGRTRRRGAGAPTLAALMMEEAQAAAATAKGDQDSAGNTAATVETPFPAAVSIRGMVGPRHGGLATEAAPELSEVVSSVKRKGTVNTGINSSSKELAAAPVTSTTVATATSAPDSAKCQGLPTPPRRNRGSLHPEPAAGQQSKALVPPAPPSGDSVPVLGVEGD